MNTEPTTAPPKISVRNLNFYYGKFHALKDINLDIPEKQVTAFIGPSGCGKSTLLRIFNRMYELYPDQRAEGSVTLDGEDLLAALFVAPAFWRKGFGSALLRHVLRGRVRLRLDVYRANTGALAFYKSMGFVPVGESLCGHTGQPQMAMLWTAPALPQG